MTCSFIHPHSVVKRARSLGGLPSGAASGVSSPVQWHLWRILIFIRKVGLCRKCGSGTMSWFVPEDFRHHFKLFLNWDTDERRGRTSWQSWFFQERKPLPRGGRKGNLTQNAAQKPPFTFPAGKRWLWLLAFMPPVVYLCISSSRNECLFT